MIHAERAKLERVITIGKPIGNSSLELLGHWGRYACVVCSGYIEFSLRDAIGRHVRNKATPEVLRYISRKLEGLQNPNAQKFVETLYLFSENWGRQMEVFFKDNPACKAAIDSIMRNRHLIAHGRVCTISLNQVEGYYKSAECAIDFVCQILGP